MGDGAVTGCEDVGLGSAAGTVFGSTVVMVAPCSNFNMGGGGAGVAAFPSSSYDTIQPINGNM
jgi:hypothetical protein